MDGDPVGGGAIHAVDNRTATEATAARVMGFSFARIEHIAVAKRPASAFSRGVHRDLRDLTRFRQEFSVAPTPVDSVGTLTFKSELLTRPVFVSVLTKTNLCTILGLSRERRMAKQRNKL
jgi:hypothetical protein